MAAAPLLSSSAFQATASSSQARRLTDSVRLRNGVLMPWIAFGTYKLGADLVQPATLDALRVGYRHIDTAFIYGGEKTERLVGQTLQRVFAATSEADHDPPQDLPQLSRSDVFITTKHWRKYHGYDASLECLRLSLKRLQLDSIDLWLMHWPGPAWNAMSRRKDVVEQNPWSYAASPIRAKGATAAADGDNDNNDDNEKTKAQSLEVAPSSVEDMAHVRAQTWRAMEDAHRKGLVRAIGVSNFSVQHLQELVKTATIQPMVNQVEMHPLHPQKELLAYCHEHSIVLQAYAALGGQDTGKKGWKKLLGDTVSSPTKSASRKRHSPTASDGNSEFTGTTTKQKPPASRHDLLQAEPVMALAVQQDATPAQVLLRWILDQNAAVVVKTSSGVRLQENAATVTDTKPLSASQVNSLSETLLQRVRTNLAATTGSYAAEAQVQEMTRLCWRNEPFRHLDC